MFTPQIKQLTEQQGNKMNKAILPNGKHTVNKELAQSILDNTNNTENRVLIPKVIKKYVEDMANGQWYYNADTIRITVDGYLVDGQHRLTSVIESDTEQEFYFITDLPTTQQGVKTFELIDMNTRKPYELLKIAHPSLIHPKSVVNLMTMLSTFNSKIIHKRAGGVRVNNTNILEFAEDFVPLNTLDSFVTRGYELSLRADTKINKNDMMFYVATIGTLPKGNKFLETFVDLAIEDGIVYQKDGNELPQTNPIANLVVNLERIKDKTDIKAQSSVANRFRQVFGAYSKYANEEEVKANFIFGGKEIIYPTEYANYTDEV